MLTNPQNPIQMKKIIMVACICIVSLTSCLKKSTCTCKNEGGVEQSKISTTTNSKSNIKKYESNCRSQSVQTVRNGEVTATTPCEVS